MVACWHWKGVTNVTVTKNDDGTYLVALTEAEQATLAQATPAQWAAETLLMTRPATVAEQIERLLVPRLAALAERQRRELLDEVDLLPPDKLAPIVAVVAAEREARISKEQADRAADVGDASAQENA
jgi:hypothetical protein